MSTIVTVLVIEADDLARKELADAVLSSGGLPLCAVDLAQARAFLVAGLCPGLILVDGRRRAPPVADLEPWLGPGRAASNASSLLVVGPTEGGTPLPEWGATVTLLDLVLIIAAVELAHDQSPT